MDGASIWATDPLRDFAIETVSHFLDCSHFAFFQKLTSIPAKRPLFGDTVISTFSRKGFNTERFLKRFMLRAPAWISTFAGFKGHSLFSRIMRIEIIGISSFDGRSLEHYFRKAL
ncbi:hypothetical protein DXM27_05175 [Rhizobium rhizogenes]|uniref:Uncharacterized protein n=1 Tax=Rhizobium rhizogenes TaxID=359 RepID=A0AA88JRU6_RHIRH|nr:hypothetical protein DXM27_05175 [Rhizobium rhizogenes]